MQIFDLEKQPEIIAGDKTILREILHPNKADLNLRYSIAHATVKPDQISAKHRLTNSEVYYILEGRGKMFVDTESADVHSGHAIYISPKAVQWIENTGKTDLKFLCIVDPAWHANEEEILE